MPSTASRSVRPLKAAIPHIHHDALGIIDGFCQCLGGMPWSRQVPGSAALPSSGPDALGQRTGGVLTALPSIAAARCLSPGLEAIVRWRAGYSPLCGSGTSRQRRCQANTRDENCPGSAAVLP
jgi:hypothetical protein